MDNERFFVRKLERMRGAGTHAIAAQQIDFPDVPPSESSQSIKSAARSPTPSMHAFSGISEEAPRLSTSRAAMPIVEDQAAPQGAHDFYRRMDYRRLERMRGAGTHVIAAQPVAFPSAPPSESLSNHTYEDTRSARPEGTTPPVVAKRAVSGTARKSLHRVDLRRIGRIRGAGTHKILAQKVDFPEPSSIEDSEQYEAPSFHNTYDDESMIDPRLRSEHITSETETIQSARKKLIDNPPMESTPGPKQRKKPASTQAKVNRAFESFFNDSGVEEATDGGEPALKKQRRSSRRQSARDTGSVPTLSGIARQQRREEHEDQARRQREQLILEQLRVRSGVPTDVHDDSLADLTMQEQAGLRAHSPSANITTSKQRPSFWMIPRGNQSLTKQEAARSEFKDLVSLAVGDGLSKFGQGLHSNDADVLYTMIKRHFQKAVASSPRIAAHAELLDSILGRLIVTFRHLSRQAADRSKLIQQLSDARRKMLAMRRQCFQKRNHVMRVMRTVDGLYQEQVARERKTKNDNEMCAFLADVRQKASAWTDGERAA